MSTAVGGGGGGGDDVHDGLRHDVRHGLGIARVEIRRHTRNSLGTRKQRLTLLGAVVVFAPLFVLWSRVAHEAGRTAAGEGAFDMGLLGTHLLLLVAVFVVMAAMRTLQTGRPEGEAFLLTATSPRAVLLGLLTVSTVQLVGFVLLPTLLFAGAFALGAGEPSVVLTTVLAVVPLFVAVVMAGTVVGQLFMLGLLQSELLRRLSQAAGVVLLLVLMGLGYAVTAPAALASSQLAVFSTVAAPTTHYLSFVFAGTSLVAPPGPVAYAVGAALLASIPLLFALAARLAPRLWFADTTPTGMLGRDAAAATEAAAAGHGHAGRSFPRRTTPPALGIALGLWTRWVRVPTRFSTLFPLVIMAVTAVFGVATAPELVPLAAGGVLAFAGIYVAGAVFGLNPLGEAGEMRVLEALVARPPRTFVRGHALAGLLLGTPLAVVGAIVLAWGTGATLVSAVVLVVLAVVAAAASVGLGLGLGTTLPSLERRETFRGYAVATPSQWVLLGHMFGAFVVAAVATLGGAGALLSDPGLSGDAQLLLTTAVPVVAAIVLLGVGYGGYRRAVARFASPVYGADPGTEPAATALDTSFTDRQLRRGLVLLAAFVGLRALLWGSLWAQPSPSQPLEFAILVLGTTLVGSVGLVYLGFTRWVGVDVVAWWVDRDHLGRDVLWGVGGFVLSFAVIAGLTLGIGAVAGPLPAAPVSEAPSLTGTLLMLLFGFAVAAFQEETLFRGFLQSALAERVGAWPALVLQAAAFSAAHVGYYPLSAWFLFVSAFAGGLVYGWLRLRRGRLLAPGIAHGLLG
ncbi:type II CAAX endopeptidase family protein [Haloglomus salinum]|uniref:type II CAAX endopeptidase family protein n=1 Tax=Haloglomus salinum TaxID=2962673 RepID=UPI0020C9A59E|nr:type II CAAX endopeptidase family protein [Haloglomus salinum]